MKYVLAFLGVTVIAVVSFIWYNVVFTVQTPREVPIVASTTPPAAVPAVGTSTISTSTAPLSSRVVVTAPLGHQKVGSSFMVVGKAPGGWFNEAVFPIQVRDATGTDVTVGQGRALGDWMTQNLVGFMATITIPKAFHGNADLILLKDNESGLPENDDSVTVPIIVK